MGFSTNSLIWPFDIGPFSGLVGSVSGVAAASGLRGFDSESHSSEAIQRLRSSERGVVFVFFFQRISQFCWATGFFFTFLPRKKADSLCGFRLIRNSLVDGVEFDPLPSVLRIMRLRG